MGKVYQQVLRYKSKYPGTIGWRLKKNSAVVEMHLNPDEEPLFSFCAQKNDNPFDIFATCVVTLTNKRIIIGRKRVIYGYFLDSITPDMFNDLNIQSNIIWGKACIETVKEVVRLSNISNAALREIETEISAYMMEEKKKYGLKKEA